MKKAYILFLLTMALAWSSPAWASPMYYTFTGSVSSVSDAAGLASQAGISVGDVLSYTVMFDQDRIGTSSNKWSTWSLGSNSYYAETYSGNLMGDTLGSGQTMNNYVQVQGNPDYWSRNVVYSGNEYANLFFEDAFAGPPGGITSWEVGDYFSKMTEVAYSGWSNTQVVVSDVTLTRIADTAPAPIVGTFWLMGVGLAGLGFLKRKEFGKLR